MNRSSLRLATAILLPLALLIHTLGYYSARSTVWGFAMGPLGMSRESVSLLLTGGAMAMLLGALASGVVGALTGPLPALALALVASAFGAGTVAASSSVVGLSLGVGILSFSASFLHRALHVGLVREFGRGWESVRTAVLLLAYAALNLGALPAGAIGGMIGELAGDAGARVCFAVEAGLTLVATVLVTLLFVVGLPVARPGDRRIHGPTLVVAGSTLVVGGAGYVAWSLATDLQGDLLGQASGGAEWIYTVNPVVVGVTGVVGAVALGLGHAARVQVPALAVAGVGAILCAVGFLPTAMVDTRSSSLIVGLVVIGAIGEPLLWAGLLSRVLGEVHFRLAAVASALFGICSYGPSLLARASGGLLDRGIGGIGASSLAILIGVTGVLLLAAAWPVRAWLTATDEGGGDDDDAPGTPSGLDPHGFSAR